ncbi:thermonuclease family protein [Chengkuizengella sp. SCS-71B]|uniref:thermonuclease family protein n=1 Tax=Chengkuizengella sp. SCS-71B TaxID=3115290 RepID=UPI0032C228D0
MRIFYIFLVFLILVGCSKTITIEPTQQESTTDQQKQLINATINDVVDGDTIKVNLNGKKETIRLLLVDTPETVHPSKAVQAFGPEASNFAKDMLPVGSEVQIEIDVSERDKYGRLLAYLWVDGKMFNEMLLEKGLARVAYIYPPNVKYVDQFKEIQEKARQESIGIWSIENYVQDDGFIDNKIEKNEAIVEDSPVQITEVNLEEEYITIMNNDSTDMDMTGWSVLSVEGDQRFDFPDSYTIKAGEAITIWSGDFSRGVWSIDLYWTEQNIWNNNGDPAQLINADNVIVDIEG